MVLDQIRQKLKLRDRFRPPNVRSFAARGDPLILHLRVLLRKVIARSQDICTARCGQYNRKDYFH